MRVLKTVFLFALFFPVLVISAQKKVALEKVSVYSNVGLVTKYWQNEAFRKMFVADLRTSLLKDRNLVLTEPGKAFVEDLSVTGKRGRIDLPNDADTSLLHLYLDIIELDLNAFLAFTQSQPDTNVMMNAQSLFVLQATLYDNNKKPQFADEIHLAITRGESPGIGVEYNSFAGHGTLPGTPKSFAAILNKSFSMLFDPDNTLALVEIKISPAYVADNYILGTLHDMPRVYVTRKKTISQYVYDTTEMIRMDNPLYEQIMVKGKKAQVYAPRIMAAIRNAKNSENSDFVFLRQDCRDVLRNKNYSLRLMVQIDPDFISSGQKAVFSNFVDDRLHCLLNEKDTVASFVIRKNVMNSEGRKLFVNKVSNGVDTASVFLLDNNVIEWPVRYNYVVDGNIRGRRFQITFTGSDSRLKEILLDGKRICIAEGSQAPTKFIVFDNSVPAPLLNELFFIAFNAFFE